MQKTMSSLVRNRAPGLNGTLAGISVPKPLSKSDRLGYDRLLSLNHPRDTTKVT